jgi:hypothetical protein
VFFVQRDGLHELLKLNQNGSSRFWKNCSLFLWGAEGTSEEPLFFKLQAIRRRKTHILCTWCFKKSFTTLKASMNLPRGHAQCFELPYCSKTYRVLPRIVTVQCGVLKKSFILVFQMLLCGEYSLYAFKCKRFRKTRHTVTLVIPM